MRGGAGEVLTFAEMADSSNFEGWDFNSDTTWSIDQGVTFPYHQGRGDARTVVATIDGNEGWRMLGHSGNITYNDFLDPIWTQGYNGSDAGSGGNSNVFFYEESTQNWKAPAASINYFGTDGFVENTSLNGILVWVYGDDDNDGSEDTWPKHLVSSNTNLSTTYNVALSYTDNVSADSTGWNLISNPYPVSLDWTDVVSNGDISNAFPVAYIWDDALNAGEGAYRINYGYPLPPGIPQNQVFDGDIPPMQSFWVKATAADASLNLKPEHQSGAKVMYKTNEQTTEEEKFWLTLNVEHDQFSDQLMLFVENEQSLNVPKLNTIAHRYVEISSVDEGQNWIIQTLNELESNTDYTIPIRVSSTEEGSFTLKWQGLENFGDDWVFMLTDQYSNTSITLKAGYSYEFDMVGGNSSTGEPRFELVIHSGTTVENETVVDLPTEFGLSQNYPNPFNPSTTISYQLPESSIVDLRVFDMLGREVATLVNGEVQAGYHQVQFNAGNLASGVYIYRLQAGSHVFTNKLTLIK